jgi:carbon-monoxide dehydrogenase medium subunit
MRPAPFRYHAPRTAEEAISLLAEHGEDARPLAGGQSLMPLMNLRIVRPAVLVDLNRVEGFDRIEAEGDVLIFKPMVRQRDAELSPLVRARCPLVAQALSLAGPDTVRNRATVGGTLAHADRTAELPGVAAALDAEFLVEGPLGRRTVPAADFFLGDLTTAVEPGEMLAEIRFPVATAGVFSIFLEAGTRQRDMAVAGVGMQLYLAAPGREARVAAIGIAPTPVRLRGVEAAIVADGARAGSLAGAVREDLSGLELVSDVHATAAYRAHAVAALVDRAVDAAARASPR